MIGWTPERLAAAVAILGRYGRLVDALGEISLAVGFPVTRNGIKHALERAGMRPASEHLAGRRHDLTSAAPPADPVPARNYSVVEVSRAPDPSANRPPTPSDAKVYLVVSDVHVPWQDRACVAAVCEYAADLRPHGLVYNGDILDFDEISRYSNGSVALLEGRRISKSWIAGNEFMDQIESACGDRLEEKHWIEGNHERRVASWLASGSNAVFADDFGLSISDRLQFKKRGIVDHGEYPRAHLKLGHLLVTHGRYTGVYPARKHLTQYSHSVLIGHCHSPQMHYGAGFGTQQAAFVAGHLADVDAPALSYAPTPNAWRHGFAVVHVRKSGAFQCQLVNLWDRCFFVGDRMYPRAA